MNDSNEHEKRSAAASEEPGTDSELSAAQLAEAKQYNGESFRCDLIDRVLDLAYLATFTWLAAVPLDRWLQTVAFGDSAIYRLLIIYLVMTLGHIAVSLPLSYYAGHMLEHKYQLSRQSAARWLGRYAKRHVLTLAIGSLTTLILYWIIWTVGPGWWLAAAGAYFLFSVLVGQLAPVLILPLFYKIERLSDPALTERLSDLSRGSGLAIRGVYRMDMSTETVKANAMLAGLGHTRRVIFGDTLLDKFSDDEIDVIFAHEVGHHVHRHMSQLIAAGLVLSLAGFWLCNLALSAWVTRVDGQLDFHQLPVHTLPLLTLVMTVFFMTVEPLQNSISRQFERQADGFALSHTGKASAYRSAFVKLARLNKADPDPHPWEVFLFHSHPPISERLALSQNYAAHTRR